MAKRITLRSNTSNNTGKGAKMTHAEMDANLESFFVSSSFDGTNLYLHSTGSVNTDTIDLSGLAALGAQGTTGAQGTAGTGTQGTQGIAGGASSQGTQGIQGTEGTGIQGTDGTQGTQGIAGGASSQGIQGTEGTGIQGTDGTQGTQGIAGGASSQGIQGTQGIQGLEGTGLQGVQGTEGTGTQGIQGTRGLQGVQGTEGTGTQGIQGTRGLQGTEGTGTQGIQGTRGLQGIQGLTGIGTQGTSGVLSTAKTLGSSSETLGDHTDGTTHTVQPGWTRLAPAGGSFTNASGGTKSYLVVLGLEMTTTYTGSSPVPLSLEVKFADTTGAIVYTEWNDTVHMSALGETSRRVTKTYVSHIFQLDDSSTFAVWIKGAPYGSHQLSIQYSLLTVTELTGTAVGTLN